MCQPCFSASATPAQLTTLTLLLKTLATVTVYRGHCRTLFFLPRIISLFIMCVGIIWNNSLLEGGRARTELWTQLLRRATLHCTRCPSALTTELHGSVSIGANISCIPDLSIQFATYLSLQWNDRSTFCNHSRACYSNRFLAWTDENWQTPVFYSRHL